MGQNLVKVAREMGIQSFEISKSSNDKDTRLLHNTCLTNDR